MIFLGKSCFHIPGIENVVAADTQLECPAFAPSVRRSELCDLSPLICTTACPTKTVCHFL